ncbi:MAG: protein translocase subunit SecF [Synergistaceae bacterium]|nr:protein translocase subunit SecF [Synergistaceae bacterium]MBQ3764965.1 protein translocase subunit SecF [Synergistaceae bacterium]MBQ6113024.1 protein translocase subunit SecF [Synergistaceae bacterium]MBQ6968912.1 protein translocase subunit SecF [Synergistaceae bacterium]MBQ7268195.1 protein translocase subunit SecF [Synergistaceae bacterium]
MRNINFMGGRKAALTISLVLVAASIVLLLTRGLNLGIDFTGGNVIQTEFETRPDIADVRSVISGIVAKGAMIQNFGEKGIIIRTNEDTEQSREAVVKALSEKYSDMKVTGFEKVGPVVGGELRRQAVIGVTIALFAILVYITLRFQFRFAVVSVVPLVHDVVIALGFFSLTQMEIGSSFIAAILTIVGYSLNNTIIILDRVRENWGSLSKDGIVALVNKSLNQTLARTINTTLTTLFPVIALCVWGGPVLMAFSYAMLVGMIAGTWSSMFVATGLLCEWQLKKK